ncbi:UDP-N-acetylglucosamine transferase subunit [Bachmanniomyces sp. S44760]|nr:UDP-N-acetylglucosamine transferase subunit [Bachmanniomyces sp. S44760]
MHLSYVLTGLFTLLAIVFFRLLYILPGTNPTRPRARKRGHPTHLLVVLGSGGHTAEMFSLLRDLDPTFYTYRTYVISAGDDFSANKAHEFEQSLNAKAGGPTAAILSYRIFFVPRARLIHQSIFTAPLSSLRCFLSCISVLCSKYRIPRSPTLPTRSPFPDLIVANGPATATILILASLLLRFLGISGTDGKMRCIYIESWARVRRMSLSGRILSSLGACDRMIVQWKALSGAAGNGKGKGPEFRGALIN